MKLNLLFAGGAAAICGASAWQMIAPPKPKLIYNESQSAPKGWYAIDENGFIKRDVLVAAFAPDEARILAHERGYLPANIPLIKTVWAAEGDKICSENDVVSTSNRPDLRVLHEDSLGRAMPSWQGCITLAKGEVFLVSTDVQTSFDSRYFGPAPLDNILGTAEFLGNTDETNGRDSADMGGARGERQ